MAAEVGDGGCVGLCLQVFEMFVEVFVDVGVVRVGDGHGMLECWMRLQNMFEELACGGLATLSHPVAGDQHVAIGAPNAFYEDWLWGHGDMAG